MAVTLEALILNSEDCESMVKFLDVLGAQMQKGSVNKGSKTVYKGQLGNFEVVLLKIEKIVRSNPPEVALRLRVKSIDEVFTKLKELKQVQIVMSPQQVQDATMGIVIDPDGRSIELVG